MLAFLDICGDSGLLRVLNIVGILINLCKIIIPLILIIIGAINYGKASLSSDQDAIKKTSQDFVKKVITGAVVFVVPSIITGILSLYSDYAKIQDSFRMCSICLSSSNDCKVLINAALYKEELQLKEQKEQESKDIEEADKKNDQQEKERQEGMIEIVGPNNPGQGSGGGGNAPSGSHQAASFYELGERAYQGDRAAMEEWISQVGPIVNSAQHSKYGIKNSMIIAQIILESGWMHTPSKYNADGSSLVGSNNVLSVNYDMGRPISSQDSRWSRNPQEIGFSVSVDDPNGNRYYEVQKMRVYSSIEDCIEDYANLVYIYHPECKNNNDMTCYKSFLTGYTSEAAYYKISSIIDSYNLTKYD